MSKNTNTATAPPQPLSRRKLPSQLLHDLRNPLNQIIGYSEMLAEDEPRTAGVVTDLDKIAAAGHRILSLIEENFASGPEDERSEALRERRETPVSRVASGPSPALLAPPALTSVTAPGLVLVVDDEPANRDVLSRRLGRQGHRVETAVDGADAFRRLGVQDFDLVLLDIMMPDMDGYEVLGRIKADPHLQHIPVIMITAVSDLQSVVRCIEAGAEDYLAKPFDPTLLKARIDSSLGKKRGRDRETALFAQLEQNYRRLQEVEKLRDEMRNMIVHDLRTPLTSVIAGIEMLEKFGELSADQREMVAIASGGGKTLLGMINDLLEVEKMETGAVELQYVTLSADGLITAALNQVASLLDADSVAIQTEVRGELSSFSGDANKLTRTLVNLLANAIKFTRAGTIVISASQDESNTRFSVCDTGEGIPEEALVRIFEKFNRLDARVSGTGFGLAFCKLAVEAHHGEIHVDSAMGKGSTFSFTIPR